MNKLTEVQKQTLRFCLDWSAPFEVAERRRLAGKNVFSKRVSSQLENLHRRGLVEFGRSQGTYRITPAGRLAISGKADSERDPPHEA